MQVEIITWKQFDEKKVENYNKDFWYEKSNINYDIKFSEITSVGLFVAETEHYLTLATSIKDNTVNNIFHIFKPFIVNRITKDLNETSKSKMSAKDILTCLNEDKEYKDVPYSDEVNIEDFISCYNQGYTMKQLSQTFDISKVQARNIKKYLIDNNYMKENTKYLSNRKWEHPKSIEAVRKEMEYDGPCKGKFNVEELKQDLYKGMDYREMAEKHGISKGSITNIKNYLFENTNKYYSNEEKGYNKDYQGPCAGKFNAFQFLTDLNKGLTYDQLGKKHNLSHGSITNIKRYMIENAIKHATNCHCTW